MVLKNSQPDPEAFQNKINVALKTEILKAYINIDKFNIFLSVLWV